MNCSPPWNSPGKNTGAGSHSLPQGIFLTQGLNPGLLHGKQILNHLSQQGSPIPIYSLQNFGKYIKPWKRELYFLFSYYPMKTTIRFFTMFSFLCTSVSFILFTLHGCDLNNIIMLQSAFLTVKYKHSSMLFSPAQKHCQWLENTTLNSDTIILLLGIKRAQVWISFK